MPRLVTALALLVSVLLPAVGAAEDRPEMLSEDAHRAWQAIGRLNIGGYRTRSACTGTLVAPDLVLTAAHCVFRGGVPAPPGDIRFAAGWFRGRAAAVGRGADVALVRNWTPTDRVTARSTHADVAFVRLSEPIDGIAPLPIAGPDGGAMRIIGYRWDRPHALSDMGPCAGVAAFAPALALTCPVVEGTSGAPVLTEENGRWAVLAVTSARGAGLTFAASVTLALLP